jgi:hypothetical protein
MVRSRRRSVSNASPTHAGAVTPEVSIALIERVPVDAVSLSGLEGLHGVAVSSVSESGGEAEMGTPAAPLNFAKVIDLHVERDCAEGEAVGVSETGSIPEVAVALRVEGSSPEPAITQLGVLGRDGAILVDVSPEPFLSRSCDVDTWQSTTSPQVYNIGKRVETAADRRNYLRKAAGWPVKE